MPKLLSRYFQAPPDLTAKPTCSIEFPSFSPGTRATKQYMFSNHTKDFLNSISPHPVSFPWHVTQCPLSHLLHYCMESSFQDQSPLRPCPVLLGKITWGFTRVTCLLLQSTSLLSLVKKGGGLNQGIEIVHMVCLSLQWPVPHRAETFCLSSLFHSIHSTLPAYGNHLTVVRGSNLKSQIIWKVRWFIFSYDGQFERTERILHNNMFGEFEMQNSTQAGRGRLGRESLNSSL